MKAHASRATASVSDMFSESQVKPSPNAHQSTPNRRPIFSSPTFQSPDLRNCTTATFHPREMARSIVPKAAVLLPLPWPVLIRTRDGARFDPGGGPSVGGASWVAIEISFESILKGFHIEGSGLFARPVV